MLLAWINIMSKRSLYFYKIFYEASIITSILTFLSYNFLHASNTNIIKDEEGISKLSVQDQKKYLEKDLRPYDQTITSVAYEVGEFPSNDDALTQIRSTLFYQGQEKQDILSLSIKYEQLPIPAILNEEEIAKIVQPFMISQEQKNTSENIDHRYQIKWPTTQEWPHRIHGHLIVKDDRGVYTGSGFLVGPNHVLTAAHNLYDAKNGKWAQEVLFTPGRSHDKYPYGDCKGCILLVPQEWSDKKLKDKEREQYDFGMVILDTDIGNVTGWLGLLSLPKELLTEWPVTVTGYPGDKGTGNYHSTQMWEMLNEIKTITNHQLFYDIDTWEGQSGSAIWEQEWPGYKGPYAVGIHTNKKAKEGEGNRGTRITEEKFNLILEWIKAYQLPNTVPIFLFHQENTIYSTNLIFLKEVEENFPGWFSNAQSGEAEALYKIGKVYFEGTESISRDNYKAYSFLYKAAEKGYGPALTALGVWYELQGKEHLLKTISLYYKAKTKKYGAEAMRRLGLLYLEGKGLPKKVETAINFLKEAANNGDGEASYHLATIYYEGKYVNQDKRFVIQYYQKAEQSGYIAQYDNYIVLRNILNEGFFYKKNLFKGNAESKSSNQIQMLREMALPFGLTKNTVHMTVLNNQLFLIYVENNIFQPTGKIYLSSTVNGFEWANSTHIINKYRAPSETLSFCKKNDSLYLLAETVLPHFCNALMEDSSSDSDLESEKGPKTIVRRFISNNNNNEIKFNEISSKDFLDEPLDHMTIDLWKMNLEAGRNLKSLYKRNSSFIGPWFNGEDWFEKAKESKWGDLFEAFIIPSFATVNDKTYVSFITYPRHSSQSKRKSIASYPQIMLAERKKEKEIGFIWSVPYPIHLANDDKWSPGATEDKILAVSMISFNNQLYIAYQNVGTEKVSIAYSHSVDQWSCNDQLCTHWNTYTLPFANTCAIPTLVTFKNHLLLGFVDEEGKIHMSCSATGEEKSWVSPQIWKKLN
jgi:V8-like Glu-specific endopeptidase/TPR repeat protein